MKLDFKTHFKQNPVSIFGIAFTAIGTLWLLFNFWHNQRVANAMLNKFTHPFGILLFFIAGMVCYLFAKKEDNTALKKVEYFTLIVNICLALTFAISIFRWHAVLWGLIITAIVTLVSVLVSTKINTDNFDAFCQGDKPDIANPNDEIVDVEINPGDFVIGNIYQHNLDKEGKVPEGQAAYTITDKKAVLPLADRFLHTMILGTTGSGKTSQSLLPMFLQDFLADNFEFKKVDVVQLGQIILEPKGDYAKTAWAIGVYETQEKREHYIEYLGHVKPKLNERFKEIKKERQSFLDETKKQPLSRQQKKRLATLQKQVDSNEFKKLPLKEQSKVYKEYAKLNRMQNGKELTTAEKESVDRLTMAAKNLIHISKHLHEYVPLNLAFLNKCSSFALFRYASLLSDIIANPDLCEDSWSELKAQDPHQERDLVMLFDPQASKPLHFNPLYGPEDKAVATVTSTLIDSLRDSSEYFQNMGKTLIQNAVHVAKQVYGNDATLMHIDDLMFNTNNRGIEMVKKLSDLNVDMEQTIKNQDYQAYFLNDYYSGIDKSNRGGTKTYEQNSGVRAALNNLLDDPKIHEVLNPPAGTGTDIDFDKILRTGDKVVLSTATGTSAQLGRMLGMFLILQLQDAIMRRPGTEETRTPVILYIDEFQEYVSNGFEQILNQGRSFVVSVNVATQTMGLLREKIGDAVANIDSNTRNKIIYPGGSQDDAEQFEKLFGETKVDQVKRSVSAPVKKGPVAIRKAKKMMAPANKPISARESVSQDKVAQPRFSKTQILYGLNCDTYKINDAQSFGDVIYRIVSHGSTQLPAGARINYIPADMKEKTDQLVRNYDAAQRIKNAQSQKPAPKTLADPLEKEQEFDNASYQQEVETRSPDTTDAPNQLDRDKSGTNTITDPTQVKSATAIDTELDTSNDKQGKQINDTIADSDKPDNINADLPSDDDLPDSSELNSGLPKELQIDLDDLNNHDDMFD